MRRRTLRPSTQELSYILVPRDYLPDLVRDAKYESMTGSTLGWMGTCGSMLRVLHPIRKASSELGILDR